MSDPADLYKVKVALAQILEESTDLYRLACAASGFAKDEYGNKVSPRLADGLLSQRDGLVRTGRDLREHIRLREGEPEATSASIAVPPQSTLANQSIPSGATLAGDGITVAQAVATLQRHCRKYVDDYRRGGPSIAQCELAARLLDALSGAWLLLRE